jgi:hypothetical protein
MYQWEKFDACTVIFAIDLSPIYFLVVLYWQYYAIKGQMWPYLDTEVETGPAGKLTSSLIILRYLWLINFVNEFYPELSRPQIFILSYS